MKTRTDFKRLNSITPKKVSLEDILKHIEDGIEQRYDQILSKEGTEKQRLDDPIFCISYYYASFFSDKNDLEIINERLYKYGYIITYHSLFGYRVYIKQE